jgi:hypothetical protein
VVSDPGWDALVELCRELAPVEVRRSRFADKPAIFLGRREVAHWEAMGQVDLRVTAAGWRRHAAEFGSDPCVVHDPRRRDWLDLRLSGAADVMRLRPLFETALRANA